MLGIIVLLNLCGSNLAPFFVQFLFIPLQKLRCFVFNLIPFSVGDSLYFIGGLYALYLIAVFFKRMIKGKSPGRIYLLLRGIRTIAGIYLLLLLLWGLNYEQAKLAVQLNLPDKDSVSDQALISFDSILISRLNSLQPVYTPLNLNAINKIASKSYELQATPMRVHSKKTLLGSNLEYWGVEGYFNPFTGEAQVNPNNLHFMQPFVVAHEMAHQTGIAAEDDANLMAYIRCIESKDHNFRYSAYFNIWLYTHRRVRGIDSNVANRLKEQLNVVALAQLDTLRARRIEYQNVLDEVSTFVFDVYLKMGKQQEGISSYRNVAYSALCWERKKRMIP